MQQPQCNLPDGLCDQINTVLDRIPGVRQLLGKCAACGLPTESALQQLDMWEHQLTAIKREFFPHRT